MWIPAKEDYDKVILEKLQAITVDLAGDGKQVPITVTHYLPEQHESEDYNDALPAIAVFQYDEVHDRLRESRPPAVILSETDQDITLRSNPTPMKLLYRFVLSTRYQTHMNEIVRQFNKLFKPKGFITVNGPDGEILDYDFFRHAMNLGYEQQFLEYGARKQERAFRQVYGYTLRAEIDDTDENTFKKVASVHLKAEEIKEGGTGQ